MRWARVPAHPGVGFFPLTRIDVAHAPAFASTYAAKCFDRQGSILGNRLEIPVVAIPIPLRAPLRLQSCPSWCLTSMAGSMDSLSAPYQPTFRLKVRQWECR